MGSWADDERSSFIVLDQQLTNETAGEPARIFQMVCTTTGSGSTTSIRSWSGSSPVQFDQRVAIGY